jgi:ring-1,2-phenylacetyl-CoA epoxidase subunit PaaE
LHGNPQVYVCGPEQLIFTVKETFETAGLNPENIHFELFTTPVSTQKENKAGNGFEGEAEVTVIMDGEEFNFTLPAKGENILDAAIEHGVDAPFSCKGAVCCTCKAKVIEGKAIMDMNYALTDSEVEQGYILTCQAHPASPKVVVDYDEI